MDEAREKQEFDILLSQNSQDKLSVRRLVAFHTERAIRVSLDKKQLPLRNLVASVVVEKRGCDHGHDDGFADTIPAILPRPRADVP